MRITVFTKGADHHLHFLNQLKEYADELLVIQETKSVKAPFDTYHPFEDERNSNQKQVFFAGGELPSLEDLGTVHRFESINDPHVIKLTKDFGPDVIFTFGTGLIRRPLIEAFAGKLLNFHGGNPEEYRGLDTHLWAIYHNEFSQLQTALHFVEPQLDTGDLVEIRQLPLHKGMQLFELSIPNVNACVDMAINVVRELEMGRGIPRLPQRKKGRYYSFMPAVLKSLCVEKFNRYTQKL